jgi:hypothetical protein
MELASLGKLTVRHYPGADLVIEALIHLRDLGDHHNSHGCLLSSASKTWFLATANAIPFRGTALLSASNG